MEPKELKELLEKNKELSKVLEQLLSRLKLTDVKDKKELINRVAENILASHGNVSTDDLKNPQFQKALCAALLSEHISSKDNNFKFDYKSLFRPDPNKKLKPDPKKLEEELTKTFTFLLTALNKLNPNNKLTPADITKIAQQMARHAVDNFFSKSQQYALSENERAINSLLVTLWGVAKPGEEREPVLAIVGNLYGIPAPTAGKQQSQAFMDELTRYDAKVDPHGINNAVREREADILCGFIPDLERIIEVEPNYKTPRNHPHPPGTV